MPYINEHAARIISPEKFQKKSFRRKNIYNGIDIIIGKLIGQDSMTTQAYRFDAKKYTANEAKKWLKDHKISYISFEPATKKTNSELNMENNLKNKPLLLFAPIYDLVATELVDKMNEIPEDEDIEIWLNSPGGRVFAGWSIIGAMQKRKGKCNMTIMGHAASMAVFFALFADNVEALEVTQFMIHRADGYIETPEDQAFLDKINKDLRNQMEKRLNMKIFEQVVGKKMDEIFDPKQRINVWIDAKQAKKIGLINSIKKLSPQEIKSYNQKLVSFLDFEQRSYEDISQRSDYTDDALIINETINSNMTKSELKEKYPELYAEILNDGISAGIKQESIRTKSWIAYLDFDKENVIASIKEGKDFSSDIIAEMSVKMASHVMGEKIEKDSTITVTTGQANDKTESQVEIDAFEKSVTEHFKIK